MPLWCHWKHVGPSICNCRKVISPLFPMTNWVFWIKQTFLIIDWVFLWQMAGNIYIISFDTKKNHKTLEIGEGRPYYRVFKRSILKSFEGYVVTAPRWIWIPGFRWERKEEELCAQHIQMFSLWTGYNIFLKIVRYAFSENTVVSGIKMKPEHKFSIIYLFPILSTKPQSHRYIIGKVKSLSVPSPGGVHYQM